MGSDVHGKASVFVIQDRRGLRRKGKSPRLKTWHVDCHSSFRLECGACQRLPADTLGPDVFAFFAFRELFVVLYGHGPVRTESGLTMNAMADVDTGRAAGVAASRLRSEPTALAVENGRWSSELAKRLGSALGVADAQSMAALGSAVEIQALSAGAILFREGDPSDAMYLVLGGELEASIASARHGETLIGRIGSGEPVGEMQMLSGGTRTATVRATGETEIARIPRSAMERLLLDAPEVVAHLTDAIARRGRRTQLASILPALFGTIDESMMREVEARVAWLALPRGAHALRAGRAGGSTRTSS